MFPISIKGVLTLFERRVVLTLNDRNEWELPSGYARSIHAFNASLS
ncbi:hypothetical protein [Halomonas dongshanensis]|uniref:NUDIX hydrolase n=1 Tax=Halomonas dongshanensis TaxID=2890835 RepID=A0ABT2EB30_9GAMM|nr:hypothetical protein [Halomonas dongshanensis]MCS2608789.1 hypothetical protein [Halomonas dongshanensis]